VLLPLFILVVIHSKVVNLTSHLLFIKHFSFEIDPAYGQLGFILSCLEAVIKYIKDNADSLSSQSFVVKAWFDAVANGDSLVELFQKGPERILVNSTDIDGNNALLIAVLNNSVTSVTKRTWFD
jgi:hypothetical protein